MKNNKFQYVFLHESFENTYTKKRRAVNWLEIIYWLILLCGMGVILNLDTANAAEPKRNPVTVSQPSIYRCRVECVRKGYEVNLCEFSCANPKR